MQERHLDALIFMFCAFLPFSPSVNALSVDIWATLDRVRVFPVYKHSFFKNLLLLKIWIFICCGEGGNFFKIS